MQALNIGIFRAIGHAGVYYGFKLGHTIPWHDGFPFNVVPHPQYVGAVMSIWGAVALVRPLLPSHSTTYALQRPGLSSLSRVARWCLRCHRVGHCSC